MTRHPTIDVHAHILSAETIALLAREVPRLGVHLRDSDGEFAVLEVAGRRYHPFPRGAWHLGRPFQDKGAAALHAQALSNPPQPSLYGPEPDVTAAASRLQNEQIARTVAAHPDRRLGLATLPMQAPELAAAELTHA